MQEINVSLLLIGDLYAGDTKAQVSREIRDIAAKADLVTVNLESPLTDHDQSLGTKNGYLKNRPWNIAVLKELSVGLASLANNHMCDWGSKGIEDTRELLLQNNIAVVGAGRNLAEAETPVIVERKGLRIGMLAFGSEEIQTVSAGKDRFGCAPIDRLRMLEAVGKLRDQAELVVVQVHWGYTNFHYPLPEHVALGHSLIDAGATLAVGHHPHVIQGFERYAQGAILYSLGDFIFAPYFDHRGKPERFSRENRRAMICLATVEPHRVVRLDFFHTVQPDEKGTVQLASEKQSAKRQRFLHRLSRPVLRTSYPDFFRLYTLRRIGYRAIRWLNPKQWSRISRGQITGLMISLLRILRPRK